MPTELFHHIVVRLSITLSDGTTGAGTGFFYAIQAKDQNGRDCTAYCIITNKHVVENGQILQFSVNYKDNDQASYPFTFVDFMYNVTFHQDPEIDLCLINITEFYKLSLKNKIELSWKFLVKNNILDHQNENHIKVIENIFMVGYPNGIMDEFNNKPLIRSGITATKISIMFQGKKEFLIDLPVFPGSSGSPIFIADLHRVDKYGTTNFGAPFFFLVGVATAYLPSTAQNLLGQNTNIGIAVNYEAINELVSQIKVLKTTE